MGYKGSYMAMQGPVAGAIGICIYSPPLVDRIWLWVYHNKLPHRPHILSKGGLEVLEHREW